MASAVKICNTALSHLGADARVASINPPDGSVESGYCADFYNIARTELLEPGTWRFALKRTSLAEIANVSAQWAFAYVLPSDCLRALRILTATAGLTIFNQDEVAPRLDPTDRSSADFDIEGDVLYTNEANAMLVYVRDIDDASKFPPSFTSTLGYLLASYLAGPIVRGNDGAKLGEALRQRAMTIADAAATASANASSASHAFVASSILARS